MEVDRKAALRSAALAARRQLDPTQRAQACAAVVTRLRSLPELRRPGTLALFTATVDEVDLASLASALRDGGWRLLGPRVRAGRIELAAGDRLEPGFGGIPEPVGPRIDPQVVDVVVLPGVAFDLRGGRLGRGGGHYDRLLHDLPARTRRIGVCFACQVVPSVPLEAHDEPVDVLVTERSVHRVRPPRDGTDR